MKTEAGEYFEASVRPLLEQYSRVTKQKIDRVSELKGKAFDADAAGQYADALSHAVEAGLLVSEAMATHFAEQAALISKNSDQVKWCAHAPKETVTAALTSATTLHEAANDLTGRAGTVEGKKEATQKHKFAADAYRDWIALFDQDLLKELGRFTLRRKVTDQVPGLIAGILASLVAGVALLWIFPGGTLTKSAAAQTPSPLPVDGHASGAGKASQKASAPTR